MDGFDTVRFIEEIERQPAIWDSATAEYGIKDMKKKSWENVVNVFAGENMSNSEKRELGIILQKRWKGIRGCYTRELSRKRSLRYNIDAGPRKSEYMYFQQLQFLQRVVDIKEMSPPLELEIRELSDDPEDPLYQGTKKEKKRKRRHDSEENDVNEYTHKCKRDVFQQDEDTLFLLSLSTKLKKVPENEKLGVKVKIMTLLHEAARK